MPSTVTYENSEGSTVSWASAVSAHSPSIKRNDATERNVLPAPPNAGLQLRRAIGIPAEGTKLLEKNTIAPAAARLC